MTTAPDNASNQPWETVAKALNIQPSRTYGQLLATWRKAEGLTQTEAARRVGISKQLLSAYETGKQVPTLQTGVTLANTLGVFLPQAIQALLQDQLKQASLTNYTVTVKPVNQAVG